MVISVCCREQTFSDEEFQKISEGELALFGAFRQIPAKSDWKEERTKIHQRMTRAGMMIRSTPETEAALDGVYKQY